MCKVATVYSTRNCQQPGYSLDSLDSLISYKPARTLRWWSSDVLIVNCTYTIWYILSDFVEVADLFNILSVV